MRAADGGPLCREAQVYYYDLLCPDEGTVPEIVRRHAATCPVCQEQIHRLREALRESQQDPGFLDSGPDEAIETLADQFRLLDERVTCSAAKPYLPELAQASPMIRIPTPVTVHVDQCRPCAEEVAALRRLDLTADQARRLKRLFESRRGRGGKLRQATDRVRGSEVFASGASLPFEGNPPVCRKVSMADLFDYIVPDGEWPGAAAAHIQTCPACLARARTLQCTLAEIAARADSETTTVYHAENDAENAQEQRPRTYQYPVSVQVLHRSGGGASERNDSSRQHRRRPRLRHRAESLGRVAVIAVAAGFLALLLWTTAPTASGLYGNDVLKALAQTPNVRIVVTSRDGRLAQEYWIARGSNRMLYRTPQRCVLFDLDQGRKRTIEPPSAAGVADRLNKAERNWARQVMAGYLGSNLERILPETKRHLPADESDREDLWGLDVYELQRLPQRGRPALSTREWVYIDPATRLPRRTESYRQIRRDGPWELQMTTVFTYPSEQELAESLQRLSPAE